MRLLSDLVSMGVLTGAPEDASLAVTDIAS
jgi:hypothetical protein